MSFFFFLAYSPWEVIIPPVGLLICSGPRIDLDFKTVPWLVLPAGHFFLGHFCSLLVYSLMFTAGITGGDEGERLEHTEWLSSESFTFRPENSTKGLNHVPLKFLVSQKVITWKKLSSVIWWMRNWGEVMCPTSHNWLVELKSQNKFRSGKWQCSAWSKLAYEGRRLAFIEWVFKLGYIHLTSWSLSFLNCKIKILIRADTDMILTVCWELF